MKIVFAKLSWGYVIRSPIMDASFAEDKASQINEIRGRAAWTVSPFYCC